MPGLVPMRRSRSSVEEDEDDHESNDASEDESPPQTGANKRARTTPAGDSRRTTGDSWHLETPQTIARPRQRPTSGLPKHQPGSIVRVTLKDFVTYSNATFYPGSSLNMVIGPNGTGKSTLVCAICLGLGWGAQNLGRAKDVAEFIKHGTSKAIIEIELKGHPGKPNINIKRQINHQKGGNHWWIDGHASNEKQAKATAEKFNIQIDNLCQFLPQDRVSEFAKMTPVEKLRATIRAAASQEMVEQHEKLKTYRKQQVDAEKELSGSKSHLANLERKQESQRGEVDKIRERQQITIERDFVEKQKPNAEYAVAKDNFLASKAALTRATEELKSLREEVAPSMEAIEAKEDYQERVAAVCKQRKTLFKNVERSSVESHKKGEELSQKISKCENDRTAEKNARKTRGKKIAVIKTEIAGLEKALENEPPALPAEWNEQRRAKQRVRVAEEERQGPLEATIDTLDADYQQKTANITTAEKQKASLATEVGQRDTLLRSANPQAHTAWQWVQEQQREGHQSPFHDRVYGPALLECSVTDESWANAVEAIFQKSEMTAITCTNHDDFTILSNKLHRDMHLPNVSLRTSRLPLTSFTPPISEDEMKRLRISGWAIDYLKGPEPVLAMLCEQRQPHRWAMLQQEEHERQQFEQLSAHEHVDKWITRSKLTNITRRREYGASSTMTRNVTQAQYWVSRPVDTRAINELDDNIAGWKAELDTIKEKRRTAKEKLADVRKEMQKLNKELDEDDKEKARIQAARTAFNTLPKKMEFKQKELVANEKADLESTQTLQNITEEQGRLSLARSQCAIDYATIIQSLRLVQVDFIEASIAQFEAESDVAALKARNSDVQRLITEREEAIGNLQTSTRDLKADAVRKRTAMEKVLRDEAFTLWLGELSEEDRNRTVDQIEDAIRILDARLDVLHVGSNNIITQFENRQREIEQLQTRVEEHDTSMQELNEEITNIRSVWEPQLDALISQISDAFGGFFNKIKCAGEVSVFKAGPADAAPDRDDDFENWSIMLKVKFREHEELSVLNSHRQSGGERAVSTMFYLMSLQRLSQAPFRVVDEINQGMDPRNERVVHSLMVDIACGEDDALVPYGGSQYFLITPKLLTGLKFHPNMKVHCIASGEYMPEDPMKLNIQRLIKKAQEKRKARAMDETFGSGSGSVSVGA